MRVKILLMLLAGLVWASPVFAVPTVKLLHHGLGTTNGGEFIWQVESESIPGYVTSDTFVGFCLEENERIAYGQTYNAQIDTGAINGGLSGQVSNFDPLDPRSAWLFWEYQAGSLGTKTNTLANQVQETIWAWEGEGGSAHYTPSSAETSFGQSLIDNQKVYVMNPYSSTPGGNYFLQNQSQIVAIPNTPTVPAPATILLAGLGVSLVGLIRRRRFV